MQDTSYIELSFPHASNNELIQAHLLSFAPLGFEDNEHGWRCFFLASEWGSGLAERVIAMIRASFPDVSYLIRDIPWENWNRLWEESITPVYVTDRIVVAPSWKQLELRDDQISVIIDPKMSFGTGFHETTRLMLRLTERVVSGGERVLDLGTGTGVLAIAAIKLGAGSAVAVDSDEWSYDNARENCDRNNVTDSVTVQLGSMESVKGLFDIILSNITRNDNIELLPLLLKHLSPSGHVILSGFYTHDLAIIDSAATDVKLKNVRSLVENEWAASAFRCEA